MMSWSSQRAEEATPQTLLFTAVLLYEPYVYPPSPCRLHKHDYVKLEKLIIVFILLFSR